MTAIATTATAPSTHYAVRPASESVEVPGAEGRVYCRCSAKCAAATWNLFAQGHDAKLVSSLVAEFVAGRLNYDEAAALVKRAGGDQRLVVKLAEATAKAHKRQQKTAARKNKGAQLVTAKVGRWTYQGQVTAGTFAYKSKAGETRRATKFQLV